MNTITISLYVYCIASIGVNATTSSLYCISAYSLYWSECHHIQSVLHKASIGVNATTTSLYVASVGENATTISLYVAYI